MLKIFSRIIYLSGYSSFCIFDCLIWILVKILPNKLIFNIAKFRIRFPYRYVLPKGMKDIIAKNLSKIIYRRSKTAFRFSNCLSRSLLSRILFDIFFISNDFHLGFIKKKDGYLQPHVWVAYPENENLLITETNKSIFQISITKI